MSTIGRKTCSAAIFWAALAFSVAAWGEDAAVSPKLAVDRSGERGKMSEFKKAAEEASAYVTHLLRDAGYMVGDDLDSFGELDRFFADHFDDAKHAPKPGGMLAEKTHAKCFAIGAYIGETVIKRHGGAWEPGEDPRGNAFFAAVKLPDGLTFWPIVRVMKRCQEGPENNFRHYADALREQVEKKGDAE